MLGSRLVLWSPLQNQKDGPTGAQKGPRACLEPQGLGAEEQHGLQGRLRRESWDLLRQAVSLSRSQPLSSF